MPDIVNPQITDAVTQVAVGNPANAYAMLYQATAHALALAAHNATLAQQNANTILQATTTQGVALLYGAVAAARASREATVGKATATTPAASGE